MLPSLSPYWAMAGGGGQEGASLFLGAVTGYWPHPAGDDSMGLALAQPRSATATHALFQWPRAATLSVGGESPQHALNKPHRGALVVLRVEAIRFFLWRPDLAAAPTRRGGSSLPAQVVASRFNGVPGPSS